ncbi:MAG TPA: alpha/beta fold hydrolase [Syntrophales bacterium]|nr:alpha/beta fold hydrolase [Syntrophales bacterium]
MKRRVVLFILVVSLLGLTACGGIRKSPVSPQASADACAALHPFFKGDTYAFEAVRALGGAYYGGADIGECLVAIHGIREGDDESWYRAWRETAERLEREADAFVKGRDPVSARECYFRASGYYRSAEFFLHADPRDPRILETWGKSRESFLKGAALSDDIIRPVEIPYENTTLPGYLCLVDDSAVKRPLLMVNTGFDGTAEELYFSVARAAVARGFHCLVFEGPGQGRVLREQKILFRPDWEKVVTPAVDFAVRQKGVDPERIALMGISMGGYLAPRAAAYEKRIGACIANGGVYDFFAAVLHHHAPPGFAELLDDPAASRDINREILENMKSDPMARWSFNDGMWKFGAATPVDWLKALRSYTLKDCVDDIRCPVLVVDGACDTLMPGQSKILFDRLAGPKTWMPFTAGEGAGLHCQAGAAALSNERVLHWLMDLFGMLPTGPSP